MENVTAITRFDTPRLYRSLVAFEAKEGGNNDFGLSHIKSICGTKSPLKVILKKKYLAIGADNEYHLVTVQDADGNDLKTSSLLLNVVGYIHVGNKGRKNLLIFGMVTNDDNDDNDDSQLPGDNPVPFVCTDMGCPQYDEAFSLPKELPNGTLVSLLVDPATHIGCVSAIHLNDKTLSLTSITSIQPNIDGEATVAPPTELPTVSEDGITNPDADAFRLDEDDDSLETGDDSVADA